MFDFLKNLTKQTRANGLLMLVAFFIWPGLSIVFFIGVAIGLVGGNLYAPVEKWVEKQIGRF